MSGGVPNSEKDPIIPTEDGGPGSGRRPKGSGEQSTKYSPSPRANTGGITVSAKKYGQLRGILNTKYPGLKQGEQRTIRDSSHRYKVTADGEGGMTINTRVKIGRSGK